LVARADCVWPLATGGRLRPEFVGLWRRGDSPPQSRPIWLALIRSLEPSGEARLACPGRHCKLIAGLSGRDLLVSLVKVDKLALG